MQASFFSPAGRGEDTGKVKAERSVQSFGALETKQVDWEERGGMRTVRK